MSGTAVGFFDLTLSLQIALASGYLAYVTSYAGFRADHNAMDQFSISLVFSSFALVAVNLVGDIADVLKVLITLSSTVLIGILWRVFGRSSWHWLLVKTGVHREDGIHKGWSALVQTTRGVSQATVYTQDGREFFLADRSPYKAEQWQGLYLCGDGSITMIVDSETDNAGSDTKRTSIVDDDFGTRFTHFPAHQIQRVELRLK